MKATRVEPSPRRSSNYYFYYYLLICMNSGARQLERQTFDRQQLSSSRATPETQYIQCSYFTVNVKYLKKDPDQCLASNTNLGS